MKKTLSLLLLLFSLNISLIAQYRDTCNTKNLIEEEEGQTQFTRSKPFQMLAVGSFLIAGSLALINESEHYKYLRNDYLPEFHYTYDNYTQYAPAAAMIIMKAAGVKSRSSWGRMLVSDAFTVALMAATVNSMKKVIKIQRPDGSGYNSYPSGHTATAFMTATMFSKEYGPRSRWYSFGAYTIATLTGYTRFLNNRHWTSDGLCGAGIGIISTELGYYLADLIFKDKGIKLPPLVEEYSRYHKPSFLGVVLGVNTILGKYHTPDNNEITFDTGADVSLDGAWFITKHLGVGGRISAANTTVNVNGNNLLYAPNEPKDFPNDVEKSIDLFSIQLG